MSAPRDPDLAGEEDYFCWLLDRAMPWAGGYAVLLEAYFDASERDGGVFCVAGFAFGGDRAKKATSEWQRLWGETQCHMTDLSASPPRGDFKGWTNDQAKERIEAAIPIINHRASFGVAVSVHMSEFASLAPTAADPGSRHILNGFRTPYAVCSHAAMAAMARLTRNSDIAYFFESGDKYQGESVAFTGWLKDHAHVARNLYGMRSYSVLDAADCRLFETADILAWEWAKHVDRDRARFPLDGNGVTRQRGSLRALLGDGLTKGVETNVMSASRRGWHMTGAPLENYFQGLDKFELLSDQPSHGAWDRLRAAFQSEFPPRA